MHLPWPYYKWKVTHAALPQLHSQKLPADSIPYVCHPKHNDACLLYGSSYVFPHIFLYHHCFFVCGSRIGKPIITAKKQDITDGTDASQMTQTINYFTIHGCQPYPFLIEWDSNKSNQKRHSKRYPPGSQCIFVDNISNATRSNKYQKHQKRSILINRVFIIFILLCANIKISN